MKRDYSKAIFYLPRDTTAKALGAQAVEQKLKSRGIEPIRNGSRGMFWLEPLLEVAVGNQRVAFGPLSPEDVDCLL